MKTVSSVLAPGRPGAAPRSAARRPRRSDASSSASTGVEVNCWASLKGAPRPLSQFVPSNSDTCSFAPPAAPSFSRRHGGAPRAVRVSAGHLGEQRRTRRERTRDGGQSGRGPGRSLESRVAQGAGSRCRDVAPDDERRRGGRRQLVGADVPGRGAADGVDVAEDEAGQVRPRVPGRAARLDVQVLAGRRRVDEAEAGFGGGGDARPPAGSGRCRPASWRARPTARASPVMLFPLAAFHQSQLAAFVQRADPFQVASGACTSSTRMLLRRTT